MPSTRNAQTAVEHLTPHCQLVRPVRLTFETGGTNTQSIEGAYYEQQIPDTPGPEPYTRQGIQLLEVPRCYIRRTRRDRGLIGTTLIVARPVCFVPEGMDTPYEWYVAAYCLEEATNREPMRRHCILAPWTADETIDQGCEVKKYRRVPVKVEYLDPTG